MWKLEFEAVDESRLPFFVGLSGKLEQSVRKREDYSKWNGKGSKRVGGKVVKPGKFPNRKLLGSKWVGGKVGKSGNSPNWKLKGSKQVGGKVEKSGKSPNREVVN